MSQKVFHPFPNLFPGSYPSWLTQTHWNFCLAGATPCSLATQSPGPWRTWRRRRRRGGAPWRRAPPPSTGRGTQPLMDNSQRRPYFPSITLAIINTLLFGDKYSVILTTLPDIIMYKCRDTMLLYLMTSAARGHWPTFVCCMVCHQIAAAPLTFLLLGSHQGCGICVLCVCRSTYFSGLLFIDYERWQLKANNMIVSIWVFWNRMELMVMFGIFCINDSLTP